MQMTMLGQNTVIATCVINPKNARMLQTKGVKKAARATTNAKVTAGSSEIIFTLLAIIAVIVWI